MRTAAAIILATMIGTTVGAVPTPPVMLDAVLYVATGDGHGSGVHIGGGDIVTSAHVVTDKKMVSVKRPDGKIASARVVWTNKEFDIALLSTTMEIPAADLSCDTVVSGDNVEAIGNPLNIEFVSAFGKIAGPARQVGEIKSLYVTNMATVMGQSGGPLFHDGKIVAINAAVMIAPLEFDGITTPTMTGFGYAVPSSVVCKLLDGGGV